MERLRHPNIVEFHEALDTPLGVMAVDAMKHHGWVDVDPAISYMILDDPRCWLLKLLTAYQAAESKAKTNLLDPGLCKWRFPASLLEEAPKPTN